MLKAFITDVNSIVPFKHVVFVNNETPITIKVYHTNGYSVVLQFKSEHDKERQIRNFMTCLTDYEEDTL